MGWEEWGGGQPILTLLSLMIGSSYTLRTTINQFLLINNWYYDCASFRWVELSSRPEDSVMQSSSKLSFGVDEYQLHSREVDSSMIPWDIWLLPSSGILWKCVGILMIAEGIPAECHGALLETIKGGERERERNKEREREGWGEKGGMDEWPVETYKHALGVANEWDTSRLQSTICAAVAKQTTSK